MADLSAYIDFSAVLNKSVVSPYIQMTDPNNYPMGVGATAYGYFVITQPDGLTVPFGSFDDPSIYWDSGAFIQPQFELRLNTILSFQNGGYTIIYYLRAPGYDDTTLTKTFVLNYTRPTVVITHIFDIFTPDLSVTDSTVYAQSGMTNTDINRQWDVDIITVNGTMETIGGTAIDQDLAYLGDYYDSQYDISLEVAPQYQLDFPNDWVLLIDGLQKDLTLYAQIPLTITQLDAALQTLKNQADAAACDCNRGESLRQRYIYASTLYSDFRRKGCDNELGNIEKTYYQMLKLFNNNVNPTYENTNEEIPAYDFECGGGGAVNWDNIINKPSTILIEWVVGAVGFPGPGDTVLTNSNLADASDARVLVSRNGLPQFASDQGDGDTYFTKVTADNFLTFSTALMLSEKIIVVILPL